MKKLYIGNLDKQITSSSLHTLFEEHGLVPSNIQVKRGYAFVDCPDQETADRAIDELNGFNLLGSVMQVEPSVPKQRSPETNMFNTRRTNKIHIKDLPPYVNQEDVRVFCQKYGVITKIDDEEGNFIVTFESPDAANDAVTGLNGQDYQGKYVKVTPLYSNNNNNHKQHHQQQQQQTPPLPPPPQPTNHRDQQDHQMKKQRPQLTRNRDNYPLLRILVNSELVGAVIGTGGSTIGDITKRTKARVDVLRQDKSNKVRNAETPIYMYGSPDNVNQACKEIMKVLQKESQEKLKEDFYLKMLAEHKYTGCIIGRGGNNITSIRKDTDTKITISQHNPNYPFFFDRIITIKGSIDNMSKAEKEITARLRQCYINERQNCEYTAMLHQFQPQMGMPGPMPGMYNQFMRHNFNPLMAFGPQVPNMVCNPELPQYEDETYVRVGDGAASVIIGPRGNNIRHMKYESGAYIHIDPEKKEKGDQTPARLPEGIPIPKDPKERIVTTRGSCHSQYKAHYFIFEKLKSQGFAGPGEMQLPVVMKVPDEIIKRIIGKGGIKVKDIQRRTGALIKMPEDTYSPPPRDFRYLEILGTHMQTQMAMNRVRWIVHEFSYHQPGGQGGGQQGRRPYNNGNNRQQGGPGGPHGGHGQQNGK